MDKEKLLDLVNTDFNKFQLEIKRFYKEEYVKGLEQQVKKQKEVIEKAIEYINSSDICIDIRKTDGSLDYVSTDELLDILKGVSE